MKTIVFCIVLCANYINAMPRGGAAEIGRHLTGGIADSIGTGIGAATGLGLKGVEMFGGGVEGIGAGLFGGLRDSLSALNSYRRMGSLVWPGVHNHVTGRPLSSSVVVVGIPVHVPYNRDLELDIGLDGFRRRGPASFIGQRLTFGGADSLATGAGAMTGLGLKGIEALGGGIQGVGAGLYSGLLTGLNGVSNLRRNLQDVPYPYASNYVY